MVMQNLLFEGMSAENVSICIHLGHLIGQIVNNVNGIQIAVSGLNHIGPNTLMSISARLTHW